MAQVAASVTSKQQISLYSSSCCSQLESRLRQGLQFGTLTFHLVRVPFVSEVPSDGLPAAAALPVEVQAAPAVHHHHMGVLHNQTDRQKDRDSKIVVK